MREDIIIDFQIEGVEALTSVLDRLEKSGAIDSRLAQDFKAIGTASKATATQVSGLVETFNSVKGAAGIMGKGVKLAFDQGVIDAVKKAGVSMEEFEEAITNALDPTKSFKVEVLNLIKGFEKGQLPAKLLEEKLIELKGALQNSQLAAKTAQAGITGLKDSLTKTNPPTNKLNKDIILLEASLKKANDTTKTLEEQINLLKAALSKTPENVKSLKTELNGLKEALAAAKLSGKDTGTEFEALKAKAGKLQDAIRDAGTEIKNAGSDTRQLDNIVGSISAVAGGFSAASGAAALFGSHSENVQKALLNVNGALALSSGLQQVSNALTKEGSLTKLADATATGFQTAAQRIYTLVTGKATAATFAFKAALLATGIGAVIALVVSLVSAFSSYSSEVNEAKRQTDDLTASLERQQAALDIQLKNIQFNGDLILEKMKQRGATESELHGQSLKNTDQQIKSNNELTEALSKDLDRLEARKIAVQNRPLTSIKDLKTNQKIVDQIVKQQEGLRTKVDELFNQSVDLSNSRTLSSEQFKTSAYEKGIADRKQADEKGKADRLKREQEEKDALQRRLQNELAAIQLRLLKTDEGSQEEIDIQKEVIRKKIEIDLTAEKLGENQKKLIREQGLKDQLTLQEDFNKKQTASAIQGLIDRNQAELANINISGEEKLRLTIENIQAVAQIEREANLKNASKLLEIDAKAASDIKAVKLAFMEKSLEDEIALNDARTGAARRALDVMAQDEKLSAEKRIAAIESILTADSKAINMRVLNLEDELAANLISQEEYNQRLAKLLDDRKKLQENAAKGITEINKRALEEEIDLVVDIASRAADLLNSLNQIASDNERARIETQKKELQALVEAGAITKKNAEIRAKELEAQEKRARQRQAQREKQAAVFNAILAIPQAFLQGLSQGGPPLAAVYAALAFAQAAIIASKPIPKFSRGKKDSYEGLGMLGEAGSELIERGGKMYITEKPTITYIGKKDKIYSHSEAKMMLPSFEKVHLHKTDKVLEKSTTTSQIDYKQLSKIFEKGRSTTNVSIHKDFVSESVKDALFKTNYWNNRYNK